MNIALTDKNYSYLGASIFVIFSLSLFIGLFLNEDASGVGTSNDFKNTWDYVLLLKNNYIIDSSQWTRLLPVHYIFLSFLHNIFNDIFIVRLIFCSLSVLVPYLFYINLKLKFNEVNKGKLLIVSAIIFILPFFRSSAIWPNPHILSLIFLLTSIYFFQRWEFNFEKKINLYLILHILFLALTVYTRRYYIFFFIYNYLFYFKYLNIKNFFYISILILLLTLPGLLLIIKFPYYLETTGYSIKYYNTIPIISSIFFFYILPFLNISFFKNKNSKKNLINILSVIFFSFCIYFFDYNPRLGGGYFIKLSNIFLGGNYFFYFTSLIGFYLLIKIVCHKKKTFF